MSQKAPSIERTSSLSSTERKNQNDSADEKHSLKSISASGSDGEKELTGSTQSFGVRKNEILNETFDNKWLRVTLYLCLFSAAYVFTLDTRIRKVLTSYATNSFDNHSLLSTISVIRSVMAAASLPFYARMSDIYGRVELLVTAIIFKAIGSIIESQASDVKRYAAGAVIDAFGQAGIKIMLRLVMSDNSKMNWRLFAVSIVTCPYIINTWISGNVVTALTDNYSWQYSIGMWGFIFPLSALPIFLCLIYARLKTRKTEAWKSLIAEEKASRVRLNRAKEGSELELQSATGSRRLYLRLKIFLYKVYYGGEEFFWESDFVGLVIFVLCWGLILVPLTLAGGTSKKWARARIIAPLVIGFLLIPVFVIWEQKGARHPVAPFPLLKDRGILAGIGVGFFYKFVFLMPHDYMYPVLLVGMNASKATATRIGSLNSFMIAVVGPLLGLVVARVRRTKAFILAGISFWMIGTGMLFHFRGDNDGVHYKFFINGIIGSQIIFGFGSGLFARTIDVSLQSCTDHEYMAAITGVYMATFKIGSAIGDSVSGAMWTQQMYPTIVRHMKELDVDTKLAKLAYKKPYNFIKQWKWETLPRKAVVFAYRDLQYKLCLVGLCLCVPMLLCGLCLRDHKLASVQSMDAENDIGEIKRGPEKNGKIYVQVNKYDDDKILKFFKRCVGIKPKDNKN